MSLFNRLFSQTNNKATEGFVNPVTTELHSHIIPGIDDGSGSIEESLDMLRGLKALGYKKVITTPHIMGDYYKNSVQTIQPAYEKLTQHPEFAEIGIELKYSAEYMVDDVLEEKIERNELIPFGNNYILIELPFVEEPVNFNQVLFNLQVAGYQPVLAHPERYPYYAANRKRYNDLSDTGLLFQMNIMSLTGYYSPAIRDAATYLINNDLVQLVGSDLHHPGQLAALDHALKSALFQKVSSTNLLNNQL